MREIERATEEMVKVTDGAIEDITPLALCAVRIAEACLPHLRGELLRKGLEVARAVAEFDVELNHPGA